MLVLSTIAVTLPSLEQNIPALGRWAHHTSWLVPSEPGMAQLLLAAIAGSCVTIVSVVYSVLLIALTFASIQFSPRILMSFLKDRVNQATLGVFIGTFAYCLILLPNVHAGPKNLVPTLSLTFALLLGTICLFYLIYFIHHIALAIQANYIVDRIARDTEVILRSLFGETLKGTPPTEEISIEPISGVEAISTKSGYIQYIDEKRLLKLATHKDITIYFHRGVGQFIPAGAPCLVIGPIGNVNKELIRDCLASFHIGPLRSMEDDVEFGILQMVDIALKAVSPAVNDPSTAISCIDHLSAILILCASLEPPLGRIADQNGVVRLIRRQASFPRLLDLSYNQISPYGKGDMAVSLRLMRALYDISQATNYPPYLAAILKQAQRVAKACAACFPKEDCEELFFRLSLIETHKSAAL